MAKFKIFGKAFRFSARPYAKKVYTQQEFPGMAKPRFTFDMSMQLPIGMGKKLLKYRVPAEIAASGAAGYFGARAGMAERGKKKKHKRKR